MKQTENKPISYIGLVNKFWKMHDAIQFTPAAISLYFYLLNHANKLYWQDAFFYADSRLRANLGLSPAKFRAARKELQDASLLDFAPGGNGHAVKSYYTVTGCNIKTYLKSKTPRQIAEEVKEHLETEAQPAETMVIPEEPAQVQTPTTQKKCNTDGLARFLNEIRCPHETIARIMTLSNNGEIGHPIWKLISEVRSSNGAIKKPVSFILSRLTA